MNTPKKRNFKIEAFKHRVEVDPKYAEKTWKVLEHAIHEIYNHNASGLSFEELYRLGLALSLIDVIFLFQERSFFFIRCNFWIVCAYKASV